MNELTSGLLVFVLSYLCGSLPSGYIIGKFNGIDIRQYGSHNIGATNVRRVLGRDWSFLCFLLDFFKGYLPVVFIGHRCCTSGAHQYSQHGTKHRLQHFQG